MSAVDPPSGGPGWGRLWTVLVSVIVLSGVVPALLIVQVPDEHRSDGWIWTLGVLIWAGVRLSLIWVAGRPRLFDFFFWLFAYIFMGLAPTVQIRSNTPSVTTPWVADTLDDVTARLVVLGLICYEIGFLAWMWWERRRGRPTETSRPGSGGQFSRWRSITLVVVGVLVAGYYVSQVGIGTIFESRDAAFTARDARWPDTAVRAIVYALACYPLLIGVGAVIGLRRQRNPSRWRWIDPLVIATGIVVLLIVINPISSARFRLGTMLFALVVYFGAMVGRSRVRATLISTLVAFVALFPIADAFRTDTVNLTRRGFFDEYMSNPDYDAFWQISNAFSFWQDDLVRPLRQLVGSVFFWVPRSVWPDKPIDTGSLLAQYRGYDLENLSAPLWAEFLVNGGIIMLVVGFIAVGALFRLLDGKLVVAFAQSTVWMVVGATIPVYLLIMLRGSLLQATGDITIMLVCFVFACMWRARQTTESTPGLEEQSASRIQEPHSVDGRAA